MAYDSQYMQVMATGSLGSKLLKYSTDTDHLVDDIEAAGYFNAAYQDVEVDDEILIKCPHHENAGTVVYGRFIFWHVAENDVRIARIGAPISVEIGVS